MARDYTSEARSAIAVLKARGIRPSVLSVRGIIHGDTERIADALRALRASGELERPYNCGPYAYRVDDGNVEKPPNHEDKLTFYEHIYAQDRECVEAWQLIKDKHAERVWPLVNRRRAR
jgi:hypothetical protein